MLKVKNGLYYYDSRNEPQTSNDEIFNKKTNVVMLQTVLGNQEGFTKRELKKANTARRLYILLGRPSFKDFGNIVKWKLLQNCPVTYRDVINAWKIYGEDVGTVRGKSVRT